MDDQTDRDSLLANSLEAIRKNMTAIVKMHRSDPYGQYVHLAVLFITDALNDGSTVACRTVMTEELQSVAQESALLPRAMKLIEKGRAGRYIPVLILGEIDIIGIAVIRPNLHNDQVVLVDTDELPQFDFTPDPVDIADDFEFLWTMHEHIATTLPVHQQEHGPGLLVLNSMVGYPKLLAYMPEGHLRAVLEEARNQEAIVAMTMLIARTDITNFIPVAKVTDVPGDAVNFYAIAEGPEGMKVVELTRQEFEAMKSKD